MLIEEITIFCRFSETSSWGGRIEVLQEEVGQTNLSMHSHLERDVIQPFLGTKAKDLAFTTPPPCLMVIRVELVLVLLDDRGINIVDL